MQHVCPDGVTHTWNPRVADPKVCPRCKTYLNKPVKTEKQPEEVINLNAS